MSQDVGLSGELVILERCIQGASILLDADGTGEPDAATCWAALATLALVSSRLTLLRRAVLGAVDPALLWAQHNAVLPKQPGDDPDVVLRAWPEGKRRT